MGTPSSSSSLSIDPFVKPHIVAKNLGGTRSFGFHRSSMEEQQLANP
ncbi:hypothetical protein M6B38_336255 [Iris pallida]|uniref:Uncharacterized protein n=1 Tax=Iris pallida TaxID=29817 RepID=A0AAX6GZL3_IRIPA|nr:hypothetical protein M6B38_336255 [Iris pallida]